MFLQLDPIGQVTYIFHLQNLYTQTFLIFRSDTLKYILQFCLCEVKKMRNVGFMVPKTPSQFLYTIFFGRRQRVFIPESL
jgi:hypothetical protein